jgi:hypothetical protein
MRYTPMGTRERRWRRGLVLLMCAIAWAAPLVTNDDWLSRAVMWGVVVGLAVACWGLLDTAPSRRDVRAAREARRTEVAQPPA